MSRSYDIPTMTVRELAEILRDLVYWGGDDPNYFVGICADSMITDILEDACEKINDYFNQDKPMELG